MNLRVLYNAENIFTRWKLLDFQEKICSIEFDCWLVENKGLLMKEQKATHKHTRTHTQAAKMKFCWQRLNTSWGLDRFIDKGGNWTEHIQRVEEDIPNVAVRYSVQGDEWERGKLRGEREQEWDGGTVAWNGIIIMIIIIVIYDLRK